MATRLESRWLAIPRTLAGLSMALWFGGFTVYAGFVVPDLHETFGGISTGEVSRRLSLILNAMGIVALWLAWFRVAVDRRSRSGSTGWTRIGALVGSTGLMVALVVIHRILGSRIDAGGNSKAFFGLHEIYLSLSGVQWLANLVMLVLDAARRTVVQSLDA